MTETFAAYLAKHYIAREGFEPGTVPEAQPLADACDIVLTRLDGFTIQVLCIVDRERDPSRTFALPVERVREIGEQCRKYCGTVSGARMPMTILVVEVAAGPPAEEDRRRLSPLKRKSFLSKVVLMALHLDTRARTAWSGSALAFLYRRKLEGLLRAPRLADAELRGPGVVFARERFPLLTVGLITLLALIFAAEIAFGIEPWSRMLAPGISTLVAFGGLNNALVLQGEWWRLFSAVLLHGDIVHLVLNGVCLYLAGAALESLVGRRWFFALFVVGGLGGSLLSLAINPPNMVSVGASGAITGLVAAAFVCSFRYPSGGMRLQIQMAMLQVLIPALIPLAISPTGQRVDFAAHLGGALTGALAGWLLLKTWSPASARPAFVHGAAAIAIAGAAAFVFSALPVVRGYENQAVLIPPNEVPKSAADAKAKAADLLARFPRDPRSHLYQANALVDRNDLQGAAQALRAGLAEQEVLKARFKPELEGQMRGMLALVLTDLNQRGEAQTVAAPACTLTSPAFAGMRQLLVGNKLCEK